MKTAMAIVAHPDDIEFLMAGTLMRLRDAGYQIHYMNLASGCAGSTRLNADTIARIRRAESIAAAESIGAVYHESLCKDLEIFYSQPLLARVTSAIREAAPDILLTHSPSDYMEDHMNTCRLAVSGAFCRGMPNFPVDPPCNHTDKQVTVYHAQPYGNRDPLRKLVVPDIFVDTTDLVDRKCEMLACHDSQRSWLQETQGLDSYLLKLRELDAEVGSMSGRFQSAEGWRRHLHLGFCGPDHDPLHAALEDHIVRSQTTE